MERLTRVFAETTHGTKGYESVNEIKVDTESIHNLSEIITTLGKMEDVMEKWHIENLEGYIAALIEVRNIAIVEKKTQFKRYIEEVTKREKLEQELAELKQKVIVPKFRTYQPIFYITQYYTSTKGNPEYDIISDKYYVAENDNEIILGWNYAKDFNQRKYYYVRKDWVFATKEEAEQKLAEIKGDKE